MNSAIPAGLALNLILVLGLSLAGTARAGDGGPRRHAEGAYDAVNGSYTVAPGDDLSDIAERFGIPLGTLEQQNNLTSAQIEVGQTLTIAAPASGAVAAAAPPAPAAAPPPSPPVAPDLPADPWPRQVRVGDQSLEVYQPQVESWKDNRIALRMAVAVKPAGKGDEAFGVVRVQGRTQVDRVQRQVVLEDLKLVKAEFPTLPDQGAGLASAVEQQFAGTIRIVPLDRLEASLGANQAAPIGGIAVQNAPPRVIVSYSPAVLVPIQGAAVLKPVSGTGFQRVINTRAVILATGPSGPYYLHLLDGWMTAQALTGPWTKAESIPAGMDDVASKLAAEGRAALLNGSPSTPTLELLSAGPPAVYVSETPSELLVFQGQPNLVPIVGTDLLWASNTKGDVIVDTADGNYYVLMAGRWYRAPTLDGTWTYVAANALPTNFSKIPAHSPAGVVLASVAGTPQAQEAAIANSIPQTATVRRQDGPTFKPEFDGPAEVAVLPGTDFQYVVNSETPIIRVSGAAYYGLEAGVWFTSESPDGPWKVADSVPDAIYGIPASSPLHYVTYVRVYGSTPEVVYDGYTPGYLGAVQSTDGVVVYGTGYDYQPWIGETWIAAPETFGLAAQPVYNPAVGYAFGFGLGLATAAMAEPYWGGAYYRPYYAGYRCCGTTTANVYAHWGDTVAAGTHTWYAAGDGTAGTVARGGYDNYRTGTSGAFAAGRSYNPDTGVASRGYGRTFDTAGGVSGGVERGERYDTATGTAAYGSRATASGPGGSSVSRDTAAVSGPGGRSAAVHQTTVDNARTGESHTVDTARVGGNVYAGADGHVYRNTGEGWQQHGAGGWGAASGDTGWADREQQARSLGSDRVSGLGGGGWGDDRFGGGGFGDGGFGGGGFGGGGFSDRIGGGGFGGRFGGGGFGGFRGRR